MTERDGDAANRFTVTERSEVPVLGLLLGGSAMVPFALFSVALWLLPASRAHTVLGWLLVWGGAILAFLAGVRRGLSFRTPGGERPAQIATMLWLYLLAIGALLIPWTALQLGLLGAGYLSLAILDPAAARRQEAPLFFVRLRPAQMAVPLAALGVAALWLAVRG